MLNLRLLKTQLPVVHETCLAARVHDGHALLPHFPLLLQGLEPLLLLFLQLLQRHLCALFGAQLALEEGLGALLALLLPHLHLFLLCLLRRGQGEIGGLGVGHHGGRGGRSSCACGVVRVIVFGCALLDVEAELACLLLQTALLLLDKVHQLRVLLEQIRHAVISQLVLYVAA
ncbi:MAG: hypothetical protein ACK55Z_00170, partial [bacterium]